MNTSVIKVATDTDSTHILLYNEPVSRNITHLLGIMGKVNNLPSVSPLPSLLADIIQARMNIKKKYSALKTDRFKTESLVNNTPDSIIDPLNKIRDNIGVPSARIHRCTSRKAHPHRRPPHRRPQHQRRRVSQHNNRYRMSIKNIPQPYHHHHHHHRRLLHNTI